jgi:hypothetical protein
MKATWLGAFLALCSTTLWGQGDIYPGMNADQLQMALDARRQSTRAREAMIQSQLDALRQQVRSAHRNTPIPGETFGQTEERHRQAIAEAERSAEERFTSEHHFLPSSWAPGLSDEERTQAIDESDELARRRGIVEQENKRASAEQELQQLEARLKVLESTQNSRRRFEQTPSTASIVPTRPAQTLVALNIELANVKISSGEYFTSAKLLSFNPVTTNVTVVAGTKMFVKPLAVFPPDVVAQVARTVPHQ